MPVEPRNVAPFLQKVRNILLGREFQTPARFQEQLATRSPAPPNLPDGPSHKLSKNYYLSRDARHEVRPPFLVTAESQKKQIAASGGEVVPEKGAETKKLARIFPGKAYEWKLVEEK